VVLEVPAARGGPGYPYNDLYAVSARIGDSWAVGWHLYGSAARTLTEHWNGMAWTRVASPTPSGASYPRALYGVQYNNRLVAVGGTSCGNLWAVGYYDSNPLKGIVQVPVMDVGNIGPHPATGPGDRGCPRPSRPRSPSFKATFNSSARGNLPVRGAELAVTCGRDRGCLGKQ
jgi:hypothetical protein